MAVKTNEVLHTNVDIFRSYAGKAARDCDFRVALGHLKRWRRTPFAQFMAGLACHQVLEELVKLLINAIKQCQ